MKKTLIRILTLTLSLCLLLPLASCSFFDKKDEGENAPFTVTEGGNAACRIVYPAGADATSWQALGNLLAKAIRRITGATLSVVSDAESAADGEILFGNTSRAASADAAKALDGTENAFSFSVSGKNMIIAAKTVSEARLAVAYFEAQYDGTLHGSLDNGSLSFPAELSVVSAAATGTAEPADLLQGAGMLLLQEGDSFPLVDTGSVVSATAIAGEKLYAALTTGKGETMLVSVSLSGGKVLAKGEAVRTGGAAGMCYNPVLGLLILLQKDGTAVWLADPETLTIRRSVSLKEKADAIAYDTSRLCYVARRAGENTFFRMDNSLSKTGTDFSLTFDESRLSTGTVTFRTMEADSRNLYLLYNAEKDGENTPVLVTLSYDGATRYLTDLPAGTPAGLSRSGRVFYLAVKEGNGAGTVTRLNIPPSPEYSEPSLMFNSENTATVDTSHLSAEMLFSIYDFIKGDYSRNTVLQGACTDGIYGYFFMEYQGGQNNYENSETHDTVIVKVEMETCKLVAYSKPLKLGHSNDGCYNPRTGLITVAYCGKNGETGEARYNRACFIDPETLELVGEEALPLVFYAISYNAYTGQYILARGGINFAVLNENFSLSHKVTTDFNETFGKTVVPDCVVGTDVITQGIDCDSKYVYFVLSTHSGTNYLLAFRYDGTLAFTKEVPGAPKEIENIFHIGSVMYVSYNGNYNGVKRPCYRLTID